MLEELKNKLDRIVRLVKVIKDSEDELEALLGVSGEEYHVTASKPTDVKPKEPPINIPKKSGRKPKRSFKEQPCCGSKGPRHKVGCENAKDSGQQKKSGAVYTENQKKLSSQANKAIKGVMECSLCKRDTKRHAPDCEWNPKNIQVKSIAIKGEYSPKARYNCECVDCAHEFTTNLDRDDRVCPKCNSKLIVQL